VHVRENGRNGADLAGRFRFPDRRVKMLNEHLVQSFVNSKNLHCGVTELRVGFGLTLDHSFALLDGSCI
jgi:hypothetical protein